MGKLLTGILILLFSFTVVSAQTDQDIIRYIFNAQYTTADSILDARITADPQDAKNYYLKQQLYYYSRYFSLNDVTNDSLISWVGQYALKTISLLENKELSTEEKFYLGSSYDYLSRWQVRQSFWDAYWSASNAEDYLEEVVQEDPEFYDAYMSLGVREYFTSRLGGWLATVAWFVGMSGDRDTALEYFHTVAEKGNLCKSEARFALGAVYRFFENDYSQSLKYTDLMLADHPNNPFLNVQKSQVTLMEVIQSEGVDILTAEFDSLRSRYNIVNAGPLNVLGYNFLFGGRTEDALIVFKTNLDLFPGVANCYDSYAEGLMTAGDTENAIKYYRLAYQKLDADTTINENFREQLRGSIPERLKELGADLNM